MTQVIFCLICLIAFGLLAYSSTCNSKSWLILGALVLSLAAGFRAQDVGIDTIFYYDAFTFDFTARPWQFKEQGFRVFVRVLMCLFDSPVLVFVVIAGLTNFLILFRLWDFRKQSSLSLMCFLYIGVFYIGTMNTMRQYLAVAIVFFATRYLKKRRYFLFFGFLAIAVSIHITALMGIFYIFFYAWRNVDDRKRVHLALVAVLLVPATIYAVYSYEYGHITNSLSSTVDNINATYFYRILSFVFACLLMRFSASSLRTKTADNRRVFHDSLPALFTLCGLIASSAGMFFPYLQRAGLYFIIFEPVFWGIAVRRKEWGWLYCLMPVVYALYVFGHELLFNGSGIFPFHFFFN